MFNLFKLLKQKGKNLKTKVGRFTFFIFVCIFTGTPVISQMPLLSSAQIFDQKYTIIPSFAGMFDYNSITLTSQKQWIGMNNSPYTFTLGISSKLGNFGFYKPSGLINTTNVKTRERIGIGFQLYSDKTGFMRNSGLNLSYAYHLPVGKNRFSFGVSLKMTQDFFQNDKLLPHDIIDPLVPEYNESNYFFNTNIGLSYYIPYNYYLGIAVHNIFNSLNSMQKEIQISEFYKRGYNFLGGKYFRLKNNKVFEPFMKISYFGNEGVNSLAGLRYFYKKGSWISIIENNNFHELQANVAILVRKFSYSLSYSYFTGGISKYQKGSVEFSIFTRFGDLSRTHIY